VHLKIEKGKMEAKKESGVALNTTEIICFCKEKKQGYPLAKINCGYAEAGKDILGDKKWHLRIYEGARVTGHDALYGYTFREGITLISDEIFEVSE
jgi:hypothetical protein